MKNKKYIFVLGLLVLISMKSNSEESSEPSDNKNTEIVVNLTDSDSKNLAGVNGLYDGYRDEGKLQVQKVIKKNEEPAQNINSNEVD